MNENSAVGAAPEFLLVKVTQRNQFYIIGGAKPLDPISTRAVDKRDQSIVSNTESAAKRFRLSHRDV